MILWGPVYGRSINFFAMLRRCTCVQEFNQTVSSLTVRGFGYSAMTRNFSGIGLKPSLLIMWPRNSGSVLPNWHLPTLRRRAKLFKRWKTILRCSSCSSGFQEAMRISSKWYLWTYLWNVWPPFCNPKVMTVYSNSPNGVITAVLLMSPGAIEIC